jgi:Short C-terminal domain
MGLIRGMARTAVVAGTATAVSNRVSRRQAERWQQQDYAASQQYAAQQQYAPPPPPVGTASAPDGSDDLSAEIERLAGMHSQGLLTDEEFAAAKSKLLGL